jgi:hypothetical protein
VTPKKRIVIIKLTFQDDTIVAYLGRNLKLSIIQRSDSDHKKGEFKNNKFPDIYQKNISFLTALLVSVML